MYPRILLYGGMGWIGTMVREILVRKGISFKVSTLKVSPATVRAVKQEIMDYEPSHIISTLGRTSGYIDGALIPTIDYLEYPGKLRENLNDNLFAPVLLARICEQQQIHFTYLGTGCIFNYKEFSETEEKKDITELVPPEHYQFTEEDLPNFYGSSYSVVKGYTDVLMHEFEESVLNIRIRMPISVNKHSKEFITKITTYKNICSIPNSMTVLDELLPVMIDLALQNTTGTLNLVNPQVMSHDEILELYKTHIDPFHTWNSITYQDQMKLIKSHRSNNHLDTHKLESLAKVSDLKTSIERLLRTRI